MRASYWWSDWCHPTADARPTPRRARFRAPGKHGSCSAISLSGAVPRSHWIRNPFYDLFFFCALWWLPVSLYVFGATAAAGTALFFLLYHLLLRLPHFAATLNFTYLYKENRQYYRANWVEYFAVPTLILVAYGARPWFDPQSLYASTLVTVATIWGMQHIAFQNYGILSLYRKRSGARADELLPKFEKAVFYELTALAVVGGLFGIWLPTNRPLAVEHAITWAIRALVAATCAAYFLRIWLTRKTSPISIPALLYFVTALSVMIYWPFYHRLGTGRIAGNAFFYVFNGQHCLAYLGLLFHMTSNEQRATRAFSSLREGSLRFARFYAPLAVGAAVLLVLAAFRTAHAALPLDVPSGFRAIGILDGIFVTHYYLESRTWKFTNPHNRTVVLPLLKSPLPAAAA